MVAEPADESEVEPDDVDPDEPEEEVDPDEPDDAVPLPPVDDVPPLPVVPVVPESASAGESSSAADPATATAAVPTRTAGAMRRRKELISTRTSRCGCGWWEYLRRAGRATPTGTCRWARR